MYCVLGNEGGFTLLLCCVNRCDLLIKGVGDEELEELVVQLEDFVSCEMS